MEKLVEGGDAGHLSIRIGLLSPYTGTNLGDQAIQSAIISNLRSRIPQVCVTGIYLNPARAAGIHDIPTFPITGLAVPFYANHGELLSSRQESTTVPETVHTHPNGARELLKRLPGARRLVFATRSLINGGMNLIGEVRWIGRMWRLVRDLDLILVAGGGQIDDEWGKAWGQPYVLFKWSLAARLLDKPFVVASVGVGRMDSALGRYFFRAALRRADYISCRDDESAVLVATRLSVAKPNVVFDIACSLPGLEQIAEVYPTSRMIAVSPIAFRRGGSWPNSADGAYQGYVGRLCEFVAEIVADGNEVVLFTTSGSDAATVDDMLQELRKTAPSCIPKLRIVHPRTVDELLDLLSSVSAVVASRLHGVILAHLIERPVLAISFDRKVDVHMRQFSQTSYLVGIDGFTAAALKNLLYELLRNASLVRSTLRRARIEYQIDLQRQFDSIVNSASRRDVPKQTSRSTAAQ